MRIFRNLFFVAIIFLLPSGLVHAAATQIFFTIDSSTGITSSITFTGGVPSASFGLAVYRDTSRIVDGNSSSWDGAGERVWGPFNFASYAGGVDGTYYFFALPNGSSGTGSCTTADALTDCLDFGASYIKAYRVGGVWSTDSSDTSTRIISVTPPDDPSGSSARATSTTFAIENTGYVSDDDFVDGIVLRQRFFNNVSKGLLNVGPAFSEGGQWLCQAMPDWLCPPIDGGQPYTINGSESQVFEWDINSSGDFSFATTTDLQTIGQYTMETQIIRPSYFLGIPTGSTVYVSTTTQFLVATTSSYDRAIGATLDAITAMRDPIEATCYIDWATPSNYLGNIQTCLTSLLAVPYDYVTAQIQAGIASFLSHAPWGYGVRIYNILTDESIASSTLPSFAMTIPLGPQEGVSFDFTPWEELGGPGSILAEGQAPDGTPILPLMLTVWDILCYTAYGFALLGLFIKFTHHDRDD